MGMDGIAKGSGLEDISKGGWSGPLWPCFADAKRGEGPTAKTPRLEAWTWIGFQGRVPPVSPAVFRKPLRGLRTREMEL